MGEAWLLDWHAAEAAGPTVVGGKGWNLARMFRYGFQVPAGGVVAAAAYARLMSEPALRELQADLKTVAADDAAALENARRLEAMQSAIRRTPLPPEIVDDVQAFLIRHGLENVPLAVRSSATAEDSPNTSFAGIHMSRLSQVGLEAVVDSIRECYASLWTPWPIAAASTSETTMCFAPWSCAGWWAPAASRPNSLNAPASPSLAIPAPAAGTS